MSDTLEDIDTSQLDNVGRVKVDTLSNGTILDMTEDCTRLVFDRLTLNQLIHLRAVCHAWNHIITIICEKKRTLQICFSRYSVMSYYSQTTEVNVQDDPQFQLKTQNFLSISPIIHTTKQPTSSGSMNFNFNLKRTGDGSFSEQQNDPNLGIRFIARLFPNITNFVCITNHQRMFELNYFLWKWSLTLDTLTIFSSRTIIMCQSAHRDFVLCIRLMGSLRRLHLFGICCKLELLNVLGQLEEFTFNNQNFQLAPYFAQLDANRCKILRVGKHSDVRDTPLNLHEANPELVFKLTHLSFSFSLDAHKNHISRHYAKFQNLTHLEIVDTAHHQIHNSMSYVLQQFVSLQKLKTLTFNLNNFCSFLYDKLTGRTIKICFYNLRIDQIEYYSTLNPNYRQTFPIFHNTITELCLLDKKDKSHFPEFKEYQLLARTFPMVKEIHIYSNNLNRATFDAQYRPRFSEAFGERVKVEFIPIEKYNIHDFC